MATLNNFSSKEQSQQVKVVMIPLPAQGHLNQLLHLSRLISSYSLPVYFISTATHLRQAKARVHGWDPLAISNIHFHEFPSPSFQSPPPNPNAPTKSPLQLLPMLHATCQIREPVREFVHTLSISARKVIVIHDSLMGYVVQDLPSIPNVESYCFQSCPAFTIYSFCWEMLGKPGVPGSQIFQNLPSAESCLPSEFSEFTNMQTMSISKSSGNLYNTCKEIDGPYIDLVAKLPVCNSEHHRAIGPFTPLILDPEINKSGERHSCLAWLDKQPENSVIFLSFGTTTSLSDEEINEIGIGLENSEQKFIWVLRDADKGDVFTGEIRRPRLPEGYEERIEGRGIIIRDWAPQLEILGHSATGGFMSHCGWNSCIESISLGVPIAAWPMHSDQPRNAILLKDVLKVAMVVRDWENRNKVVKAMAIENVVRKLMDSDEGKQMRERAAKLSDSLKKSLMEGGGSRSEMDSFIAHICK